MKEYIKVIFVLLGFILILFAASFATKLIGQKYVKLRHSKYIKIIDQIMLGRECWLYIIQIGEILLLVGVSNDSIKVLKELKCNDLIPISEESNAKFSDLFNKYARKQNNKDDVEDTNFAYKFNNQMQSIKNAIKHHKKNRGEGENGE
ncbi:MAG TPA: FliO/MopB family protein [Clostridiales bacterium]|nr:FliO/MopB family protein [Clostridiales bacterium]